MIFFTKDAGCYFVIGFSDKVLAGAVTLKYVFTASQFLLAKNADGMCEIPFSLNQIALL